MEAFIVLTLFVFFSIVLIYRCATGKPAMPEGGFQQAEEPATDKAPYEPPPFPKIYLPPRRPGRQAYRRVGAAITGAALLGAWDSSGSHFIGEIEMDDSPLPESHDFHDCSLSTGNIDIVHGGYDPTGNYGMAGDFNPHFDDSLDHSDPFESDFGTCEIGCGISDSFGSDIVISTDFGSDIGTCDIGISCGFDD